MGSPINVWSSMRAALHPDLRWLIDNQQAICEVWPAGKPWRIERPIKVWPDGRVRIEFVHTWPSFGTARRECEDRLGRVGHPAVMPPIEGDIEKVE